MMIFAPNFRAHREAEEVKGKFGGIWWEEERDADYGRMVQLSQQRVAPRVKGLSGDWAREVTNQMVSGVDGSFPVGSHKRLLLIVARKVVWLLEGFGFDLLFLFILYK